MPQYVTKLLARLGSARSQCRLGYYYYSGQGVEQDYDIAAYWYRRAAEQGYSRAQYNLGCCYYLGRGAAQDYRLAIHWYGRAAEHGNPRAQYAVGYCYEYGKGVEQNYNLAQNWYGRAVEKGHLRARKAAARVQNSIRQAESSQDITEELSIPENIRQAESSQNITEELPISENQECVICQDASVDTVLINCGHAMFCRECVRKLDDCPICRQTITGSLRIILP